MLLPPRKVTTDPRPQPGPPPPEGDGRPVERTDGEADGTSPVPARRIRIYPPRPKR